MFRSSLLLLLCLLGQLAAIQLNAPGVVKCPALQLGHRVISKPSCTRGSSVVGTACPFDCHKGFRLVGPAVKHCQMDGTWTDAALPVSCDDINECDINNGFCSHICENTAGSYKCKCPKPLYLDPTDQRTCRAHGVQLTCNPNHMEIVLPKNLIHNLGDEHLSLLDPTCRANGNATHYSLSTNVTGCGTRSHVYKNFIVYTNRVLESPNKDSDVITHVGKNEIKVPFSCYFNDLEIVSAVGFKPVAQKIHVYVKGRGNYALSLDIFKDKTYGEGGSRAVISGSPKYTEADFPVSVHLRERLYVQASLDTRETDLKIFASNCCSTPMQDHEATMKFRHTLITEGCPVDPSVQFHNSSDPTKIRFSFEVFKFLGDHDYVFIHCRVHVCDVNDPNSRCAKGCMKGNSSVSQDQGKKPVVQSNGKRIKKTKVSEKRTGEPLAVQEQKTGTKLHVAAKRTIGKPVVESKPKRGKVPVHKSSPSKIKLHAAAKKTIAKPVVESKPKRGKAPLHKSSPSKINLHDNAKKSIKSATHHIMRRFAGLSRKKGVLGSADVSKGPFIFEAKPSKHLKRGKKPGNSRKVFDAGKGKSIRQDAKRGNRSGAAPSATNVLLVAMTVASIMALIGVVYLGRKAIKTVHSPYNYDPVLVN